MNITIAKNNNEQCIAYTNKGQNIFILYEDMNKLAYRSNSLIIDVN